MAGVSRQRDDIRAFVLQRIAKRHDNIIDPAMRKFGISRSTVNRHIRQMVEEGLIEAQGSPRTRRYSLVERQLLFLTLPVEEELAEDRVWLEHIKPHTEGWPPNVIDLLEYGASEMINNVIDHSGAALMVVTLYQNAVRCTLSVADDGIGIFEKIKADCKLLDTRHALLELSKGKLTTAPAKHSGEGLFFTSRMFDEFMLDSRGLTFYRWMQVDDSYLVEAIDEKAYFAGTFISMVIDLDAEHTCAEIFAKYEDDEDPAGFSKTHVPVRLAQYKDEQLVSRSQAKRVLTRFERFSEVMLDFEGVPRIGQAFADEIFRVYALAHPEVTIVPVRMGAEVERMWRHVMAETWKAQKTPQ